MNERSGSSGEPRHRAAALARPWASRAVLLVDDHDGFRTEARALLELDGFDVVGEAADAAAAVDAAGRLHPGAILLDVGLPDADGLSIVEDLREQAPGVAIVIISGREEADFGGAIARAGADAFIAKRSLGPGVVRDLLARLDRP